MMARAARHYPERHWGDLCRGLFRVLYDEEGLSPHLHFPAMAHLKEAGPHYEDPWDRERYEREANG